MLPIVICLLVIIASISAFMRQKTETILYTKPYETIPADALAILFTEAARLINEALINRGNNSCNGNIMLVNSVNAISKNIHDVITNNIFKDIDIDKSKYKEPSVDKFIEHMSKINSNSINEKHYCIYIIISELIAVYYTALSTNIEINFFCKKYPETSDSTNIADNYIKSIDYNSITNSVVNTINVYKSLINSINKFKEYYYNNGGDKAKLCDSLVSFMNKNINIIINTSEDSCIIDNNIIVKMLYFLNELNSN
jgi:hypothetical protein